jgi:hypothetical protein
MAAVRMVGKYYRCDGVQEKTSAGLWRGRQIASGHGREVRGAGLVTLAHNCRWLPASTKMMFNGIAGEVEKRIAMRCSDSPSRPARVVGLGGRTELHIVLYEIHQRLFRIWLNNSVLAFVCFHFEFSVFTATTRRDRSIGELVLCKSWRREQKEYEGSLQVVTSNSAPKTFVVAVAASTRSTQKSYQLL